MTEQEPQPIWSMSDRAYRCPVCLHVVGSMYFTARQHVRKCDKAKEEKRK